MNQLEMLTILVDAVRTLPETPHLRRALKRADHRIEVLRQRKARRVKRAGFQARYAKAQSRWGMKLDQRWHRYLDRAHRKGFHIPAYLYES